MGDKGITFATQGLRGMESPGSKKARDSLAVSHSYSPLSPPFTSVPVPASLRIDRRLSNIR